MVRINREYLDPALRALSDYTQIEIGKLHAKRKAHDAVAEAISRKAKAAFVVKTNLSRGAMIFLVLLGIGLAGQMLVKSIAAVNRSLPEYISPLPPGPISPVPHLLIPAQMRDTASSRCRDNRSFETTCADDILLANGSTYTGTWWNGYANGSGILSFQDGGSISGEWENGALVQLLTLSPPNIETNITRGVTVFNTISAQHINPLFSDVTVGHNFESTSTKTWSEAFCYLNFTFSGQIIRLNLSIHDGFGAPIVLYDYTPNSNYSRGDMVEAQGLCPYQWVGF